MENDETIKTLTESFRRNLHSWCEKYEQLLPVLSKTSPRVRSIVYSQLVSPLSESGLPIRDLCRVFKASLQRDSTTLNGHIFESYSSVRGRNHSWFETATIERPSIPPNPMADVYRCGYEYVRAMYYPKWMFFDSSKASAELQKLCVGASGFRRFSPDPTSSCCFRTLATRQNWMGLKNTLGVFEARINLTALDPTGDNRHGRAFFDCRGYEKNPTSKFASPRTILESTFTKFTTRYGNDLFKPAGIGLAETTEKSLERIRDYVSTFLQLLVADLRQTGYEINSTGPFETTSPYNGWTEFSV